MTRPVLPGSAGTKLDIAQDRRSQNPHHPKFSIASMGRNQGGQAVAQREWEIEWSDFLSVGIPEIDDEHRRFISRVNDVNRAIVELEDKVTVERLLDLMLMEATGHFRNEVRLLQSRQYPHTADHARKHEQLSEQFSCLIEEFRKDNLSYVWALKGLRLKQLLVEHLLQEDMKFKEYLAG